ncbi:MAG: hypothetical protein QOE45_591 [Frankiaceae bacterium]|jgi:hypothetical protein|nr:hypothetical protein [Frankiaceae bacterium]
MDDVRLTDLEVIQRYSIAVRGETADRAELVTALRADLAWLESGRRARTAPAAKAAPAKPAKPAKPAAKKPAAKKPAATKPAAKPARAAKKPARRR